MKTLENITIEKLVFGGKGLAKLPDGKVVFITGGAVPGSIVNLKILKKKKDFMEAQITQIVKKSPFETENHPEMTGAPWLNIDYKAQLDIKQKQVKEAFFHVKKYQETIDFLPIIESPEIYGYRNKIEFSFGKYISGKEGRNEQFNVGFHKRGEFSRVEDYDECLLISKIGNEIYRDIKSFCKSTGFEAFDQKFATGFFRHLVMRMTKNSQEIMIILSIHPDYFENKALYTKNLEKITDFFKDLAQKYPQIRSIYYSHNDNKADISIGELELIYGQETISEAILGLEFEISPKSFFQTNSLGAEKLYSVAKSFLRDENIKCSTILDLYAGTGTLGMIFASHAQKIYSVELVEQASRDGEKNATKNKISNIEFINAKVEDFLNDFKQKNESVDVLIIDPPRAGMHPSTLPNIAEFNGKQIIYISCNPATLARDLEFLVKDGKYAIEKVQAVDMFPHTHHIEVVVSLVRK